MSGPGLGYEVLGAVKVKDGLFVGDELAAQDLEFVVANKVTRVINCCGRQVPHHWEPIGVVYLTYHWADADNQIILDQRDVVANEIFRFIEEGLEGAESVLIHSVRGQSRSCCVLSAYMMKKYNWGLRKTMEFLSSRRPDLNLKPAFLQQLSGYERRLMAQSKTPFSLDWNDADFSRLECEELLLRNTYINSQMGPLAEFTSGDSALPGKPRKLFWLDDDSDDKTRLEKPAGADRHNLAAVQRLQQGGPILKGVIKPKPLQEPHVLQRRASAGLSGEHPMAHSLLGEGFAQSVGSVGPVVGTRPASMGHGAGVGLGMEPVRTAWAEGDVGHLANSAGALRASMEAQGAGGYGAAVDQSPHLGGCGGGLPPGGCGAGPMPHAQAPPVHRGPATSIRDSLSGLPGRSRDEYGGPGGRSRDPSPKTSAPRRDSPLNRGDSPLRRPGQAGRAPSPQASQQQGGRGGYVVQGGPHTSGSGNLNFGLGGIRTSIPSGGPAAGPGGGNAPGRGMGSFRSGGPVRAKADLLGESGNLRRSRPATAPATRPSGGRPASPLGQQRSSSSSRQASPLARPPSPGAQARHSQSPPVLAGPPQQPGVGCPWAQLDRSKHRSLSSHMRRAPSPTPAFNRNPSPSRPRWRG
eukprot:TRINITY_DN25108_c0_g1_i3.p1 TRINITY_DN25108_c0_g1~~TRINITY_DN25108_c0_g1_i3.p1  ORF type:complete len:636 (+),score=85.63 TRINITY_DN25108_c0_g1_i3:104-2011(+)